MNLENIGPVQMLVIGFDKDAEYRGAIMDELEDLTDRGLIRVIDLQFVMKEENGDLLALEMSDLSDDEAIEFGGLIGGLIGMGTGTEEGIVAGAEAGAIAAAERSYGLTLDDINDIATDLEPGEAVGMLLFEHVWAARLRHAIRSTGGFPIAQGFLTPEVLLMMGSELQAIVEAEQTIEVAEAVKAAAILDAMITVEEAEEVKSLAVAEAVQALIVAGLIEDYAAQRAIDALVVAGLIEEAAIAEAEEVVALAEAETAAALEQMEASQDEPAEG